MRLLNFVLIIILVMIISSCNNKPHDLGEPATCTSYLLGYYSIDNTEISLEDALINGEGYHKISIITGRVTLLSSVFNFPSDNGLFDYYSSLHGDTAYRERLVYSLNDTPIYSCSYPASDFTEINVHCLQDWDETHPNGSSLNELTRLVSITCGPFIRNGYKQYDYDAHEHSAFFSNVYPFAKGYGLRDEYPIDKMLDKISAEDIFLLGDKCPHRDFPQICTLFIKEREEEHEPCTLRIDLTNTDGIVYSSEVTVDR